jgi:tripartite-type tricarboxylate transporter receptor subunit TctC
MYVLLVACGFVLAHGAFAQTNASAGTGQAYPARPVRLIVPFPPGGGTDIQSRIVGQKLAEALGQQVVIDNRAGAAGNVGMEVVARSSPDGYTIMLGSVGLVAINPVVFPKFPVIPLRDFIGIMQITDVPGALVVHPTVPVKSTSELVAYLKANPGKLNYGSPGAGSANRLEMEMFRILTGTQMTHVPYKGGAGQMIPAIMGNEIQFMFINMASSIQNIRAGRIKPLATTWPTRRPELPEIPTVAEAGFPGYGTNAWNGLFAPATISKPLLARIHADVVKVMTSADMKAALDKQFMTVVVNKSPEEFSSFVREEIKKWGKVATDNNIVVE